MEFTLCPPRPRWNLPRAGTERSLRLVSAPSPLGQLLKIGCISPGARWQIAHQNKDAMKRVRGYKVSNMKFPIFGLLLMYCAEVELRYLVMQAHVYETLVGYINPLIAG